MILNPLTISRRAACPSSWQLENELLGKDRRYLSLEKERARETALDILDSSLENKNVNFDPGITDEMLEGAHFFRDRVVENFPTSHFATDYTVKISIGLLDEIQGKIDAFGFGDNTLHVYRYHYGFTPLQVYKNLELIESTKGILNNLICENRWNGLKPIEINYHLIQPRNYQGDKYSTWKTMSWQLIDDFEKIQTIEYAAINNKGYKVSEECGHCPVRHACPALQQVASVITEMSRVESPILLKGEEVSAELRLLKSAAKLLDARITGLEGQAEAMLNRGDSVPLFSMKPGQGREYWTIPVNEVDALGAVYGVEVLKEREAITPKQAIKAGLTENIVKQYSRTKHGHPKLTQENLKQTERLFNNER